MKRADKLTKRQQQELVIDLINAFVGCKSVKDATYFLQDLLTLSEMKILAKRLRIAKLLLSGVTYEEIEKRVFVSHGTIAKIAAWLAERGDGFREIIEKLPKQENRESYIEISDWDRFKRHHALYFWPELLLEEIIKNASKKQKSRIADVLDRLEEKSELHKRIEHHLKYNTT